MISACPVRCRFLTVALLVLIPRLAAAELWRSPLHDRPYFQIEKKLINPHLDAEVAATLPPSQIYYPVPAQVLALLGPDSVDYESFVAGYPRSTAAAALLAAIQEQGLSYMATIDRTLSLPHHAFPAGVAASRTDAGFAPQDRGQAVPGLFVVQFAFPLKDAWLRDLGACASAPLALFQERAVLVRAANLGRLLSCGPAAYLSWVDSYLTSDRVPPGLLTGESPLGYNLQFPAGTDLAKKIAALPPGIAAEIGVASAADDLAFVYFHGTLADLRRLVAADPDLVSVTRREKIVLSDERLGQIVAGNFNSDGSVTAPGYRNWLNSRGLLSASNPQTVAVVDRGYDNGILAPPHHPDLGNPARLVRIDAVPATFDPGDIIGHGTIVSGIIAGDGTAGLGTGATDVQGFLYGSGISPGSKLVHEYPNDLLNLTYLDTALNNARNNSDGSDLATIANYSSNRNLNGQGTYDDLTIFWDSRVLDANSSLAGQQPMTVVVSAGNFAYDTTTGTILRDSVTSPATGKNVITVGATTSYRPVAEAGEPPIDCQPGPNRPPNQDALHVARLGLFSGRGATFNPFPGSPLVSNTRVKPDLVAPGVRIISTVPYNYSGYNIVNVTQVVGCAKFFPTPNVNYYSYGTGTSFAAPVVTGVATHARKWFMDRGTVNVSPSLIKAALIATADDIGGQLTNDHRPSLNSGWGRVSLARLTDGANRFYTTDNLGLAVTTGQARSWTRTIGNTSLDTYIVLVWSDPPSVTGSSQVPLVNDLMLAVQKLDGSQFWRGNNFNENVTGNDNGYSYTYTVGASSFNDTINNVETVFIPAGTFAAGQQLTLTITGVNVPQGPQKFAIYAYNLQASQ